MLIALSSEMREIDKRASEKYGIPSIILMENAAQSVYKYIRKLRYKKILVVCGTGNNGGDGFALARLLKIEGLSVEVVLIGSNEKIKGDARINYDILDKINVPMHNGIDKLIGCIDRAEVIVDALLGTGIKGTVNGEYKEAINLVNKSHGRIVSIDIPSGIDADTGEKLGECIYADDTITFGCIKRGMVLNEGLEACGNILLEKISIPMECIEEQNIKFSTNYKDYPLNLLKPRGRNTNKGDYGKVFIIGGNKLMSGAVILCGKGALRTGSGLVTCVIPKSIVNRVGASLHEATYIVWDDDIDTINTELIDDVLDKVDVIAFGIGMGRKVYVSDLLKYVLKNSTKPIVIDADGLNALCSFKEILTEANGRVIITPHPGEMSRLTGYEIEYINKNRVDTAVEFARKYNCTVLLKGASTVVTDGREAYINTSGNPGMASGGSGDVLTGIIASLIGQGYSLFEAGVIGSFIHGKAGDEAYMEKGFGLTAGDITNYLGGFLKQS